MTKIVIEIEDSVYEQIKMHGNVSEFHELILSGKVLPKGHWKVVSDGYGDNAYICECSECKDTVWIYKDADREWNYCPNCGAKMDEEDVE